MSWTVPVNYAPYINDLVKTSGRNGAWLRRLYDPSPFIPGGARGGTISVPQVQAFTAGDPVDGTMLTNGYNNTIAALTGYDKAVTISVQNNQVAAMDFNPGNIATIAYQAADAIQTAIAAQVIANLVAATPGSTEALADGKIDFAGAGATELAAIDRAIAYVLANSDANIGDLTMLCTPLAWGNIFTARNNTGIGASFAMNGSDMFTYMGIPVYPVAATTTAWGSGGNACVYVLHRNAEAVAYTGAYPHDPDRFWIPATDGFYKHIINGSYFTGVTEANLIAEITSGSS